MNSAIPAATLLNLISCRVCLKLMSLNIEPCKRKEKKATLRKLKFAFEMIIVLIFVEFFYLAEKFIFLLFSFPQYECTLLKWRIENTSPWVDFPHHLEKMHLLTIELIFISSSWRIYMHMKFVFSKWKVRLV